MKYLLCIMILLASVPCSALNGDSYIFKALYADLGFTYHVCAREVLNQNYQQGILQAAIISAFKEIGDQMYSEGMFGTPDSGHWLMDARGGDAMDIFWCTLGAACVPLVFEFRGWTVKMGWIR